MKKFKIFPLILIICLVMAMAAPGAYALDAPDINAKAAVLVDLDSGKLLYGHNQDEQRAPASLTKIMTVLLTLEAVDSGRIALSDIVTAQDDCRVGMADDSSTSFIMPGDQVSVKELLYCCLLQSANEGCNILGRYIGGSIAGFVEMMNQKAAELGCVNTHFMNTNGLTAEGHYSSAYDISLMFRECMKHPLFMEICNTTIYYPEAPCVNGGEPMNNSNALINITSIYSNGGKYLYDGATGGKTGYTNAAGYCLVTTAERNGVHVLAVVLGCDGALNAGIEDYYNFIDSGVLYDWAFDNFSYRSVLSKSEVMSRLEVALAETDSLAMLRPATDLDILIPNETADEAISREVIIYDQNLKAPLAAGTVLGEVRVSVDGEHVNTVKLVNSSDIELSRSAYLKARLGELFSKGWVIALLSIVLVFAVIYIALVTRYRKLRRRHLQERKRAEQRRKAEREQLYRSIRAYQTIDPSERFDSLDDDFAEFFDDGGEFDGGD